MEHETILDAPSHTDLAAALKKQRKKLLIWVAALTIFNTVMYPLVIPDLEMKLKVESAIQGLMIGVTMIGFVLGALCAHIPFKGLPFSQKYLRASLLCMLVLQSLIAVAVILNLFLLLFGTHR